MVVGVAPIQNISELSRYVDKILCLHNDLEVGGYPMTTRHLTRRGAFCGITFCLHGPRAVKLIAIWEADSNSILFFDSSGERTHRKTLSDLPLINPL